MTDYIVHKRLETTLKIIRSSYSPVSQMRSVVFFVYLHTANVTENSCISSYLLLMGIERQLQNVSFKAPSFITLISHLEFILVCSNQPRYLPEMETTKHLLPNCLLKLRTEPIAHAEHRNLDGYNLQFLLFSKIQIWFFAQFYSVNKIVESMHFAREKFYKVRLSRLMVFTL